MISDPDEKRASIATAIATLLRARDLIEQAGLKCRIISAGGSGSYQLTADIAGITEIQAGGGIFACRYYTEACHVTGIGRRSPFSPRSSAVLIPIAPPSTPAKKP